MEKYPSRKKKLFRKKFVSFSANMVTFHRHYITELKYFFAKGPVGIG